MPVSDRFSFSRPSCNLSCMERIVTAIILVIAGIAVGGTLMEIVQWVR